MSCPKLQQSLSKTFTRIRERERRIADNRSRKTNSDLEHVVDDVEFDDGLSAYVVVHDGEVDLKHQQKAHESDRPAHQVVHLRLVPPPSV